LHLVHLHRDDQADLGTLSTTMIYLPVDGYQNFSINWAQHNRATWLIQNVLLAVLSMKYLVFVCNLSKIDLC